MRLASEHAGPPSWPHFAPPGHDLDVAEDGGCGGPPGWCELNSAPGPSRRRKIGRCRVRPAGMRR